MSLKKILIQHILRSQEFVDLRAEIRKRKERNNAQTKAWKQAQSSTIPVLKNEDESLKQVKKRTFDRSRHLGE
jgi:hypothetical protein